VLPRLQARLPIINYPVRTVTKTASHTPRDPNVALEITWQAMAQAPHTTRAIRDEPVAMASVSRMTM
jgi:hypothetical protein